MKRNFYIIGHNPNSVEDSIQCLKDGANAIEPDVHLIDGKFYVGEKSSGTKLPFEIYLNGLRSSLLANRTLNLSMVVFDIKDSNCAVVDLLNLIRQNFSGLSHH